MQGMWPLALFTLVSVSLIGTRGLCDQPVNDFSDAELEAGKAFRDKSLKKVGDELEVAEEQRRIAVRSRNLDAARELAARIKLLTNEKRRLKATALTEFAGAAKAEKEHREKEEEQRARERAEKYCLPPLRELEGCGPLAIHDCQMIKNSTAALVLEHGALEVSRLGVIGNPGHPILIARVVATSADPVVAYEISFEVEDGFGKRLTTANGEHFFTRQNTLKAPLERGQVDTAMNWGGKEYKEAFAAKAWVSKVRLAGGKVWEQSREQAMEKKHGVREAERVDKWISRECRE